MSRPLRIEFPGACYHVTARGNGGQPVFSGIEDGRAFLDLLGREIAQQRWLCHGYCLMENLYHLLIETPEGNLGRGMGRLNMRYSQWFGRRHGRPGHLFRGRYKAILFEKQTHLLELSRHVVANPVRARMVNRVDQWRWSSFRALATGQDVPGWLTTADVLAPFDTDLERARAAWRDYVADQAGAASPWDRLRAGHYLGSERFLRGLRQHIDGRSLDQVPSAMADPARPTAEQILEAVIARHPVADGALTSNGRLVEVRVIRLANLRRRRARRLADDRRAVDRVGDDRPLGGGSLARHLTQPFFAP